MYDKILVCLDASSTAQNAAEHGIALARKLGSALRFVCVVDLASLAGTVPALAQVMSNDARLMLDDWLGRASQWALDVSTAIAETSLARPRIAEAIDAEAGRWGAKLIVLGSHGRSGVQNLLLGSVAEAVARSSRVPVLLVHPGDQRQS